MFYSLNDIQIFLETAQKRKGELLPLISRVSEGDDAAVISRALTTDFAAEDFYKYDSDMCEQFLQLMKLTGIAK